MRSGHKHDREASGYGDKSTLPSESSHSHRIVNRDGKSLGARAILALRASCGPRMAGVRGHAARFGHSKNAPRLRTGLRRRTLARPGRRGPLS